MNKFNLITGFYRVQCVCSLVCVVFFGARAASKDLPFAPCWCNTVLLDEDEQQHLHNATHREHNTATILLHYTARRYLTISHEYLRIIEQKYLTNMRFYILRILKPKLITSVTEMAIVPSLTQLISQYTSVLTCHLHITPPLHRTRNLETYKSTKSTSPN